MSTNAHQRTASANTRTFAPIFPPTSGRKHTILPRAPFGSFTLLSSSSTPALSASRCSSRPHSSPRWTRAQCALCSASSSGAPRVYERSQSGHVRSVGVSKEKCSCVSLPCFGFVAADESPALDLDLDAAAPGARRGFLDGVLVPVSRSARGRFRLSGGGEVSSEGGEEGGAGFAARVLYVRLISAGMASSSWVSQAGE